MSNELTYILGAGASFQSIPVVKTFNKRLLRFERFLKDQGQKVSGNNRAKYDNAAEQISFLFNEFSSHQSFDTYFKKLFHLGDSDKINLGKRLLHLYFLWEHSNVSMKYNVSKQDPDQDGIFYKESLFDKRYDALIAGLLKPISGKPETLCKVNFITWNYDINLLHSIKNFFYPKLNYGDFLQKVKQNQFLFSIDDRINIINVNGYFYSSGFDKIPDLSNFNVANIIDEKVYNGYHEDKSIDEDAGRIRFAWELNNIDEQNLKELLISKISLTENLIIVGYNFPVYNRFIDFGYLTQEDIVDEKVVIQNPNSEVLRQDLIDIYRISEKSKIQTISNCDSFYLPSSVFGINEYSPPFSISVV
jgi:hypothetical protein